MTTEQQLRKLNAWIDQNVMLVKTVGDRCKLQGGLVAHQWNPTTDPGAAMEALTAYYKTDPNDVLLALHNFLIRKEFKERTMSPEKVCLFIKEHYERNHK